MKPLEEITKEELGNGSPIALEIVDTEEDIYYHMALDMFEHITAIIRQAGIPYLSCR